MPALPHRALVALLAFLALAVPAAAQDATDDDARLVGRVADRGARLGIGPFVGSGPGAAPVGPRVPTVGIAGDLALLRVGALGLHAGATIEHRAGARMTGVVASAVLPVRRHVALRLGAAVGGAEVQRAPWAQQLGWRDWRGVDAAVELRLGRTTGALVVRSGTIDAFVPGCPPEADCIAPPASSAPATRFTRLSFESRYAFF